MSKKLKIEGWVLKKKSLPNQDKIITFFTHEFGKIIVFAKGVKKITSRRLPLLETGNLVKAIINQQDHRFYLDQTILRSGFITIKENDMKTKMLYFFLFILERLLPENQQESAVYDLTRQFFIDLAKVKRISKEWMTWYLNRILILLGYIHKDLPFHVAVMKVSEILNENPPPLI